MCLCSCLDLDVGYILNYRRFPIIESDWQSGILYNSTGMFHCFLVTEFEYWLLKEVFSSERKRTIWLIILCLFHLYRCCTKAVGTFLNAQP